MTAWERVRANPDTQFAPLPDAPPPAEPPGWLKALSEWLGEIFGAVARFLGLNATVVMWIFVAIGAALAAWILWRLVGPIVLDRTARDIDEQPEEWAPRQEQALALLEDADRLALDGRYDEATHLLLLRSVHHIAEARPGSVERSSTAREIAALPALSNGARAAFGTIADRVERSLFALRALTSDDWLAARDAYSEFALGSPLELARETPA